MKKLIIFCVLFFAGLSGTAQARRAQTTKADATITVQVESVAKAMADVNKAASALGAKTVSRNMNRNGQFNSSTVMLSISVAKADDLLGKIRTMGEVSSESASFNNLDSDEPVNIQITLNDRKEEYVARGKRSNFLAGGSAVSSRVNGLTPQDLNFTGWGLTVSVKRRSAQLSILSLKLDKEAYAEKETDPELEKIRMQLEKEKSGSMAVISHSTYSSFFGDGNRPFLNPFAGITYGYSHLAGSSLATIGGQVGIDLVNLGGVVLGTSASMLGLYNSKDGATSSQFDVHLFIPF